jgi:hypothetical protein
LTIQFRFGDAADAAEELFATLTYPQMGCRHNRLMTVAGPAIPWRSPQMQRNNHDKNSFGRSFAGL